MPGLRPASRPATHQSKGARCARCRRRGTAGRREGAGGRRGRQAGGWGARLGRLADGQAPAGLARERVGVAGARPVVRARVQGTGHAAKQVQPSGGAAGAAQGSVGARHSAQLRLHLRRQERREGRGWVVESRAPDAAKQWVAGRRSPSLLPPRRAARPELRARRPEACSCLLEARSQVEHGVVLLHAADVLLVAEAQHARRAVRIRCHIHLQARKARAEGQGSTEMMEACTLRPPNG